MPALFFLFFLEIKLALYKCGWGSSQCMWCIYILAKSYTDWMTAAHTFGRPKAKWQSLSEGAKQAAAAVAVCYTTTLSFPKPGGGAWLRSVV